jgi:hypothetical protein
VINYLSNTGIFNGNTMQTISERYENLFTPAGYAFSIWGLIYLGLLGFVSYTGRVLFKKYTEEPLLAKIGWWFVLSCVANSLWVITWLNDFTGFSVILMIVLFVSLLKIVINTRMELDYHPFKNYLFIFWPFALYFGWISVAMIANIAAFLTKINWDGWGFTDVNWTIIMICIAGLINIMMIITRNLREYGVVGIWALMAIAGANKNNALGTPVIYSCYIVSALILIFIIYSALKHRDRSINRM